MAVAELAPRAGGGTLVEILPVRAAGGRLWCLRPDAGASWTVGCAPGAHPGDAAVTALEGRGLYAAVVHSTSWRYEAGSLVLTYIAVLDGEEAAAAELTPVPVRRHGLARGGATAPPERLDVDQVLHHALRHLAWLEREDPAVATALDPAWRRVLAGYLPEPFHTVRRAAGAGG